MATTAQELGDLVAAEAEPGHDSVLSRDLLRRERPSGSGERGLLTRANGDVQGDQVRTIDGGGIDDRPPAEGDTRGDPLGHLADDPTADLLGLGEAAEDLGDDCVVRTPADRVMRRVVDHPSPGELQQAFGPRSAVERRKRLGIAFEHAFRPSRGGLEVDPR